MDGRVLFGKSSDREPDEPQALEWHPARRGLTGRVQCTWIEIPEAPRTHAVLLSRPAWMWGAEMGVNEHGVAIGNEAVFTRERVRSRDALTGMDLVRLALERATTAAEAKDVIVTLAARHGQGGRAGYEDRSFRYHSSFLIADPTGALVLETTRDAWATERVKGARAISNALTIEGFAERHGDRLRGAIAGAKGRRRITESCAERAESPRDMARALESHGPTRFPRYDSLRGAVQGPCMHAGGLLVSSQTTASLVAELTPTGARAWATATSAPCLSLFKPVRVDSTSFQPETPALQPDESLWWRHERFHRTVMRDPARAQEFFSSERERLQEALWDEWDHPDQAWREADLALHRWTTRVRAMALPDTRPPVVRRHWAARRHP